MVKGSFSLHSSISETIRVPITYFIEVRGLIYFQLIGFDVVASVEPLLNISAIIALR